MLLQGDWGPDYFDIPYDFEFEIGDIVQLSYSFDDSLLGFVPVQLCVIFERWSKGLKTEPAYHNFGYRVYLQQNMTMADLAPWDIERIL